MSLEQNHPVASVHAEDAAEKIKRGLEAVGDDISAQDAVVDKVNSDLRAAGIGDLALQHIEPANDIAEPIGKRTGLRRSDIEHRAYKSLAERRRIASTLRASFDRPVE